ncbi:MAG: alkane 1-monooxygenase [Pseudomonadota bacterium]|nr:alkane 1-monooxygenase [Pseudomonadota bacterium]
MSAIWKYSRFFIGTWIVLAGIPITLIGGAWPFTFFASAIGALLIGELLSGRYEEEPAYEQAWIFYPIQYFSQLASIAMIVLVAWYMGLPNDLFGLGAAVGSITGVDILSRQAELSTVWTTLGVVGLGGLAGALASIAVGHELTHRTENPLAVFIGRLGEAFSLFTHFSIRHPYGHHNLVCTPADPATARRGENFYHFMIRSIVGQKKMTWDLEAERLQRMGKSPWDWRNKALRGWGMELLVVVFFIWAAGLYGLLGILGVTFVTHLVLELANYIEHYGLVRVPTEPMQVRHAWNSNVTASYYVTVAISRHSHHHADASVEFWDLKAFRDEAPTTIYGYGISFLIALIPPLWNELMAQKLLYWDLNMATPEERRLAMTENLQSGIPDLVEAAKRYFAENGQAAPESAKPHPVDRLATA